MHLTNGSMFYVKNEVGCCVTVLVTYAPTSMVCCVQILLSTAIYSSGSISINVLLYANTTKYSYLQ